MQPWSHTTSPPEAHVDLFHTGHADSPPSPELGLFSPYCFSLSVEPNAGHQPPASCIRSSFHSGFSSIRASLPTLGNYPPLQDFQNLPEQQLQPCSSSSPSLLPASSQFHHQNPENLLLLTAGLAKPTRLCMQDVCEEQTELVTKCEYIYFRKRDT